MSHRTSWASNFHQTKLTKNTNPSTAYIYIYSKTLLEDVHKDYIIVYKMTVLINFDARIKSLPK